MMKSPIARWTIGIVVALVVLGLLRFKPWQQDGGSAVRQQLQVGFLPVT
jgi:hypothetical protein